MKQYTFKDGFKCVASSVEEAKSKHKVTASDSNYAGRDILRKLGFHPDDGDFVLNLDLKYRFCSLATTETRFVYAFVRYFDEQTACVGLFVEDTDRYDILKTPINPTSDKFEENLKKFIEKASKIGKSFVNWK